MAARQSPAAPSYDFSSLHLIDVGANLLDDMYQGCYHGSRKHDADVDAVLRRAAAHGVRRIIVTAGTPDEAQHALTFIREHSPAPSPLPSPTPPLLYTTCGIHPTRTQSFASLPPSDLSAVASSMLALIQSTPSVVAVGECGLDADRVHFSSMAEQRAVFPLHLDVAARARLPLFLHDRNVGRALLDVIAGSGVVLCDPPGVVHSFTGSVELMSAYLGRGFYIGLNGCSLRDPQGLDVARAVPLDRVVLETDAPWCDVKPTHAGWPLVRTRFPERRLDKPAQPDAATDGLVKGRNEPCKLIQVAEVVAGVRGISVESLVAQVQLKH